MVNAVSEQIVAASNRGSNTSIAVVGGGISGLTAALRLAKSGCRVTLIEASNELGGLGAFFEYNGRTFEKFYHCMLPSDGPLLQVLEELGIRDDVYWKPTTFAYADSGRLYPLNTPVDLLKFAPLHFLDRVRVGLTGLYGKFASDTGLDDIRTVDWLTRLSGRRAFKKFWQPMLEAKFGDRYHDVPALWFWTRFNREKGQSSGERKGYIRGGYKYIIDCFVQTLRKLNVEIQCDTVVHSIDIEPKQTDADRTVRIESSRGATSFDKVVLTLPTPQLNAILSANTKSQMPALDTSTDYQGVINCVMFIKRPLSSHYWIATPESHIPFDGVVETSNLTDLNDRGSRHVVYLTKYMHRNSEAFATSDSDIQSQWVPSLLKLFPELKSSDIEACFVFRAPFVEPIYRLGQKQLRPPETLVPDLIYLANTAQVYPVVTSWNGSVMQAEKTIANNMLLEPQQ